MDEHEGIRDPKTLRVAANAYDRKADIAYEAGDHEAAERYTDVAIRLREKANRIQFGC